MKNKVVFFYLLMLLIAPLLIRHLLKAMPESRP
jgi:hypothetical protein